VVVADLAAAGAAPTVTIEAAAPEAAPLEAAALDSAPPEAPPPEVASPAFEPAPAAAVVPLVADDLTRMVGIGPKLSAGLAERGVTRFAQIAAWTAEDLAEVDGALQLKGRAVREAWVAQAKRLAWD
jgi:predicted flap endonuclease-1-like 5' DNA nuclease